MVYCCSLLFFLVWVYQVYQARTELKEETRMNGISRTPAHTVAELESARQHQENPAGHHGARERRERAVYGG